VHQALRSQAAHSFEPFGPVRLKGVEEAQWLYALGDGPATAPAFTEEPEILESSWLYGLITKKWPQAAGGIIAVLAGAQWIAQGLTTSGVLESYLFAWGVVTTGLWFMFDKAERAVAAPVRRQAASSLSSRDFGEAAQTIPDTFVETFDTIFGKRHLSVRCLTGSIIASLIAVAVITLVWLATMWPRTGLYYAAADDELIRWTQRIDYLRLISFSGTSVLVLALIFNLLPDFASLLQTRLLIKSAHKRRGLWLFLGLDLLLTATLSVGFMYGVSRVVALDPTVGRQGSGASEGAPWEASPAAVAMWDLLSLQSSVGAVNIVPIEDWVIVEDEVLEEPRSPDEWAIREFATELQDRCPQSFGTIREANDNIDLLKRNGCWQGRRWDGDSFSWDRALMPEWLLRGVDQDSLSAVLVTRPPLFNAYSHSYVKYQSEWRGDGAGFPPGVLFYSAFFTSIWLWLYAASVLVSRVLLRMNSGVGFLLRVTDVEKQPFRSMGFVSVILVSCLFALGLPLVLL